MENRNDNLKNAINKIISNIRDITPYELHLTMVALEPLEEKMAGNKNGEEQWATFLEALPTQVRKTVLALHAIREYILNQIEEEFKIEQEAKEKVAGPGENKGKKLNLVGPDVIQARWKKLLQAADITWDKNDLYLLHSKISYLSDLFKKHAPDGLAGERMGEITYLNAYLTETFNINEIYGIKTSQQDSQKLKEINEEINKINSTYDKILEDRRETMKANNDFNEPMLTVTEFKEKMTALTPLNKQQTDINKKIDKIYNDSFQRIVEDIKNAPEQERAILSNFVKSAEKMIPPLGERKGLLNQIKNCLKQNQFNRDEAYSLISKLNDVAVAKRDKSLITLCSNFIKDNAHAFNIDKDVKFSSSSMLLFKKQQETNISMENTNVAVKKPSK